jgi:hypothetical protein
MLDSYSTTLPSAPSLISIVGPRIPFERGESIQLVNFLEAGGIVLLSDDYGTGNSLLENLNVSARFSGRPLADLYFYSKSTSFPIISHFTSNQITMNLTTIVMDHPTFLDILDTTVTVLAVSSPFSFIDVLNNGTLEPTEKAQPYPVIASTRVGKGLLVLVANSYAFTNEMIGLADNRVLFNNLLRASNERTAFDVAHLKKALLTDYRVAFRNEFDASLAVLHATIMQLALTATLIAVFSVIYVRERTTERHREDSRSLAGNG